MKTDSITYQLGSNANGQPLRLTRDAQKCWALLRDQGDQRDDSATIFGLTDRNIFDMAEAVKAARQIP